MSARCKRCPREASQQIASVWLCSTHAMEELAKRTSSAAPRRRARRERLFQKWAAEDNGPGHYEVGGDEERPQF